ncbi:unnamed protein product [Rangifer tarandus platyrhynchus]|uniref:Uncharacterized protein n=1 Tax=Rangifer tarandus platyrhynchus TaxID=3082113 RepID=A0ABN9A3C5_RANTA|nr:unnamed protein product [Rangifer tarandus platyrhynchus]
MDCSPPGSSVHGIFLAGILEWVATPSSRGSSRPRDLCCLFCRWILYLLSHQGRPICDLSGVKDKQRLTSVKAVRTDFIQLLTVGERAELHSICAEVTAFYLFIYLFLVTAF